MVRLPFHLSNGHLPTEHTVPSLVSQRARNDVNDVFTNYGFPHIDSQFITIHVKNYTTWTEKDVRNSQNCIKLLWNAKDDRPKPNDTLDSVRRKLDKKRVLNVGVLPQFCLLFY